MHQSKPPRDPETSRLSSALALASVAAAIAAVATADGVWAVAVGALLAAVHLGSSSLEQRYGLASHSGSAATIVAAVIFIAVWATAGLTFGLWLLIAVGGLSVTLGVDALLTGRFDAAGSVSRVPSTAPVRLKARASEQPPQTQTDQSPTDGPPAFDPVEPPQQSVAAPIGPVQPQPMPPPTESDPAPSAAEPTSEDLAPEEITPQVAWIADLTWSTLRAMRDLDQATHNYEICHAVAEAAMLNARTRLHMRSQRAESSDWSDSEWDYRVRWALSALHNIQAGAVEQTVRGWWRVTEGGRAIGAADAKRHARVYFEAKLGLGDYSPEPMPGFSPDDGVSSGDPVPPPTLQEQLMAQLWALAPPCFEELCAEALRRTGYRNVHTTGGPGDSGIDVLAEQSDATGTTPVYVQCKAWRGEVTLQVVQEFREALRWRSNRGRPGFGWLMTTGAFSTEARAAAERAGATRLKLVDGSELCGLLAKHGDIVFEREGSVEVNHEWFDDLVRRCRATDRYKIQAYPPGRPPLPDPPSARTGA